MRLVSAALGLLACLGASVAFAEIEITTRADGTVVVTNDGASPSSRSGANYTYLRPVPDAELWSWILSHADSRSLHPRLVQAVIQVESSFDPRAVSNKGAMGLMQLMPETARALRVSDPFDPEQNIRGGTTYLRQMLDLFDERLELALAAYNAGPTAVQKHNGIPPYDETRLYVRRVMALFTGVAPDLTTVGPVRSSNAPIVIRTDTSGQMVVTNTAGRR